MSPESINTINQLDRTLYNTCLFTRKVQYRHIRIIEVHTEVMKTPANTPNVSDAIATVSRSSSGVEDGWLAVGDEAIHTFSYTSCTLTFFLTFKQYVTQFSCMI